VTYPQSLRSLTIYYLFIHDIYLFIYLCIYLFNYLFIYSFKRTSAITLHMKHEPSIIVKRSCRYIEQYFSFVFFNALITSSD